MLTISLLSSVPVARRVGPGRVGRRVGVARLLQRVERVVPIAEAEVHRVVRADVHAAGHGVHVLTQQAELLAARRESTRLPGTCRAWS